MAFFGMVTTRSSHAYTRVAMETFARTTARQPDDVFILIDNDGDYPGPVPSDVRLERNASARGFSANVNHVMRQAAERRSDLYFLNNDLVFTEGWLEPLRAVAGAIVSPLSNREVQYETDGFRWSNHLVLDDYIGREPLLDALVRRHRATQSGVQPVIALPFFCVKIPYQVYATVGLLDESFGRGGAEDDDYCVRARLAGFDVCYALESFVLHFSGKSTWSGGETEEQTRARCQHFREVLGKKWGSAIVSLLVDHDMRVIEHDPQLRHLAQLRDLRGIVERLVHATSASDPA